jgi:SAM-dependent methyltransferase
MSHMDLATLATLRSPLGLAALAAAANLAPTEATFLSCFTRLSKRFAADLARSALEEAILRARARAKFANADAMLFTREALEQASGEVVAAHRAERFAPFSSVADLCCGIGGDTIALAAGRQVVAVDADPLRLALAEHNVAASELRPAVTFVCGDVLSVPLPGVEAVFCDPDRRVDGRRQLSIQACSPPLDALRARFADLPLGVKLAPGAPREELGGLGAELEYVEHAGELKECAVWFGRLRTAARRATVLPGRHTLWTDQAEGPPARAPAAPGAYLYDPGPAVVRAGLLGLLAEVLDAHPLDGTIAYLTGAQLRPTPFARSYRVEGSLPFQIKRLRAHLRELKVGHVTVLKRGSALAPEELVRQLRLDGPESRHVVLTRVMGRPFALVARLA